MAIKRVEIRPKDSNGNYNDIVYPKTSADMVEYGSGTAEDELDKIDVLSDEFDSHKGKSVTDENGAHDLRINQEAGYVEYFDGEDWKNASLPPPDDDKTDAPGPKILIGGTMDAGFFGEVSASELINGSDLSSELGITQGNLQNSNEPYLKFAWKGKIQFVNKKTIRNSISWDAIYEAGAVYGTGDTISAGEQWMLDNDSNYSQSDRVSQDAQVTINGLTYRVRLMRGAADDPTDSYDDSDRGSIGPDNEWNALMLPIHENAPDNWEYGQYVESPTEDWGVGYTDEDLLTHSDYGDGSYSWTQETRDTSTRSRVYRGFFGVSLLLSNTSSNAASNRGPRFVLELV